MGLKEEKDLVWIPQVWGVQGAQGRGQGWGVGATESQIWGHEATGQNKVVLGERGEGEGPPKGQSKDTHRVGRLRNIPGGGKARRGGAQMPGVTPCGTFPCSLSGTSVWGSGGWPALSKGPQPLLSLPLLPCPGVTSASRAGSHPRPRSWAVGPFASLITPLRSAFHTPYIGTGARAEMPAWVSCVSKLTSMAAPPHPAYSTGARRENP